MEDEKKKNKILLNRVSSSIYHRATIGLLNKRHSKIKKKKRCYCFELSVLPDVGRICKNVRATPLNNNNIMKQIFSIFIYQS